MCKHFLMYRFHLGHGSWMYVHEWGMEHLVDLYLVNLDHGRLAHAEVGVLVHLPWAVVLMATLGRLAEDHHIFHSVTELLMIQPKRGDHPFQLLRETMMMVLVRRWLRISSWLTDQTHNWLVLEGWIGMLHHHLSHDMGMARFILSPIDCYWITA